MSDEKLPILETMGLVRVPKGWTVVLVVSQGLKIIDKQVLSEPEDKLVAWERLKIENVRRFWVDRQ